MPFFLSLEFYALFLPLPNMSDAILCVTPVGLMADWRSAAVSDGLICCWLAVTVLLLSFSVVGWKGYTIRFFFTKMILMHIKRHNCSL